MKLKMNPGTLSIILYAILFLAVLFFVGAYFLHKKKLWPFKESFGNAGYKQSCKQDGDCMEGLHCPTQINGMKIRNPRCCNSNELECSYDGKSCSANGDTCKRNEDCCTDMGCNLTSSGDYKCCYGGNDKLCN